MIGEYIKSFLKTKVFELKKKIQESPNKIDDKIWEFLEPAIMKWIDSL